MSQDRVAELREQQGGNQQYKVARFLGGQQYNVAISIKWQSVQGGKVQGGKRSQQPNMCHLRPAFLLFLAFAPCLVVGQGATSEPGSHSTGWQWPPRAGWPAFRWGENVLDQF